MHFLGKIAISIGTLTVLILAEPSVYGNSSGLYAKDKMVVKNKKTIAFLQQKIAQQNERIDGLMSVLEGLSTTVNELRNSQNSVGQSGNQGDSVLLKELGSMIDKINANYVSKDELRTIMQGKKVETTPAATKETSQKEDISTKNVKELYSEGVRLFVKNRYDEAKKRFTITDTKGYKPAASNYYLGEIAYYTKAYDDAVFYFKKSAGLYDKASYIDTLLLHTAISLEKNGEKEQARAFYENIIENYANKKTASIAKDKLKNL